MARECRRRRIRDEDCGSIYYDESDEFPWEEQSSPSADLRSGAGVFDIMKNVTTKAASTLTGKAAKKIAEKAIEKGLEKGAEKVGEKTGQLIGEKIYDRFQGNSKVAPQPGEQIIKELQAFLPKQKEKKPSPGDTRSLKGKESERQSLSISQRFDELLKGI